MPPLSAPRMAGESFSLPWESADGRFACHSISSRPRMRKGAAGSTFSASPPAPAGPFSRSAGQRQPGCRFHSMAARFLRSHRPKTRTLCLHHFPRHGPPAQLRKVDQGRTAGVDAHRVPFAWVFTPSFWPFDLLRRAAGSSRIWGGPVYHARWPECTPARRPRDDGRAREQVASGECLHGARARGGLQTGGAAEARLPEITWRSG